MTLRLGFVGVGRWSRKLAESFRACGAEIVAHDSPTAAHFAKLHSVANRCDCGHPWIDHTEGGLGGLSGPCHGRGRWMGDAVVNTNECYCKAFKRTDHAPGFGSFMPWRDQLADKSIDAIVAVAPPEITTEVVLAAAAIGKPIMGTKPLWSVPDTIRAPVWCDFWRLWTYGHAAAKEAWEMDTSRELLCNLYGDGPFRDFPGALDYGPHVMATLLDMQPGLKVRSAKKLNGGNGELFRVEFGPGNIVAHFGNAGQGRSDRRLTCGDTEFTEAGDMSWGMRKDDAIRAMCNAFVADCHEGYGDSRLMDLSREGMKLLRQVREMAK